LAVARDGHTGPRCTSLWCSTCMQCHSAFKLESRTHIMLRTPYPCRHGCTGSVGLVPMGTLRPALFISFRTQRMTRCCRLRASACKCPLSSLVPFSGFFDASLCVCASCPVSTSVTTALTLGTVLPVLSRVHSAIAASAAR